jgi:hypothetical protein
LLFRDYVHEQQEGKGLAIERQNNGTSNSQMRISNKQLLCGLRMKRRNTDGDSVTSGIGTQVAINNNFDHGGC